MPTFSVKTDAGDGLDGTGEKLDFPHTKAATDDAQVALVEMAKEKLPNGKAAHFGVEIEDDTGKQVYKASLDFAGETQDDLETKSPADAPPTRP